MVWFLTACMHADFVAGFMGARDGAVAGHTCNKMSLVSGCQIHQRAQIMGEDNSL